MAIHRLRSTIAAGACGLLCLAVTATPVSAEGVKDESWPCSSWEAHSYTPDYSDVWATTFDLSNCDTVRARAYTDNWTTAGNLVSDGSSAVSTVGIGASSADIHGSHNGVKGADSYWVYT